MSEKGRIIEGEFAILKPIDEEDFEDIIRWRNDPKLNKFVNQPFKLDYSLQERWYREKYLPSEDILFIMVQKGTGKKYGTYGINDVEFEKSTAIAGRLMVGEYEFRGGTKEFIEALSLFYDYLLFELDFKKIYTHVVNENKKALSTFCKLGYLSTTETVYPHYCRVNNMNLLELLITKERYIEKRENMIRKIVTLAQL